MKKKNEEAPSATPTAAAPKEQPAKGTRNIYVFGRLENEIVLPVIKRLLKLNELDPKKPINIFINSSGGNGYNADAIIATMHSIEAKVNAICLGHALSGACEILASATGERSAYEFATLMFHQTLWEADGDITNLEIQAAQGKRFREAQVELLHRCTGQEKRIIREDIERDHYMSAQQALEYGIIDKIMKHTGARKSNGASSSGRVAEVPVAAGAGKAVGHSNGKGRGNKAKGLGRAAKKSTRAKTGRGKLS
jgi:ATP-dependent Clp protease protease subunit